MLNKALALLGVDKMISEESLKKGLQKINPKFKKFFDESSKYGYPIGAAMGFLKSEMRGNPHQSGGQLRPDESANAEIKRQEEAPQRLVGKAANIAGGAAVGGLGGSALSALGSLIGNPQSQDQKMAPMQPDQAQAGAREGQSPIEILQEYDPNLAQFVHGHVTRGRHPIEAGALAIHSGKFTKPIRQIENDMGMNFADFLQHLYGAGPSENVRNVGQPQQPQEQPQQPQAPQGQGQSPGKDAFMQGLQQIAQQMRALRGGQ